MKKRVGEEINPKNLEEMEDIPELEEPLENKTGDGKKAKNKADDFAEEPDVDPGIDYMRWSD